MINSHLMSKALLILAMALAACTPPPPAEKVAAGAIFPRKVNVTYLSFDPYHGFQVNYLHEDGTAWLWYPGNRTGVPELWKTEGDNICFKHPSRSYNPVTKQSGGKWQCQKQIISLNLNVAELDGDVFNLRTGRVPYPLPKCKAPKQFSFDRTASRC